MKITVTGGSGFLGSSLVGELLRDGHTVTVLTRSPDAARAKLDRRAKAVHWGEGASPEWKTTVSESDAVIHLAGESVSAQRWTPEFKRRLSSSRVEPTRALVKALREGACKPSVLLSASAVGFYGDRKDELLTEKSPPGSDFLASLCVEWEREVERAAEIGVREARLRIGIVLGEGGALERMIHPLPVSINPYALGLGGPLGSGKQWFPWVHASDVIGLFLWALKTETVRGAINAVSPNPVRNREFAQALGTVYHRPALLPVPGFALKAMLGEFADSLLGGQRAVPAVAESRGYRFQFEEIQPALNSLLREGSSQDENPF